MNEKIHEYIYSKREEMTEALCRLVRIPSIKSEAKEGAPYGEACRKVLAECKKLFSEHGFECELHQKYLLAYSGNHTSKRIIATLAHADVVPADEEKWTKCKPFEPALIDGYLYGRGVHDDKAGIIIMLYAAKAIRELSLPFASQLTMFVGADEESGMDDVKAFVAEQPMPDIGLVPDSGFPVKRGETSLMQFFAVGGRELTDILALEGEGVFNRVLADVKLTLRRSEKLEAELTERLSEYLTLEKDGDTLILTAKGITKHAASPEGSVNAMLVAAKALAECDSFADRETMADVAALIEGGCGISERDFGGEGQFAKPTCANGIARLSEGRIELAFDTRFLKRVPHEELCAIATEKMARYGFTYRHHKLFEGFLLAEDDGLVTAMLGEYKRFTGNDGKPFVGAGGTYSRALKRSVSVGTTLGGTRPDIPDGHGGMHQPDEYMEIDAFLRAAELFCRMLVRCDAVE